MDERQERNPINDLMQPLPASGAQAAHHRIGGGYGQCREPEQSNEANGEIQP